ncbi:inverse autotransporter beta domain-containing protein [Planctomicrobium sp. SH527]|uniref:inverse autotransporter beta domain-containing protein n=1 Tax=Planctomicrobium sp. SH527 TaxID=3448123 RepID=UPI003F5B4D8F
MRPVPAVALFSTLFALTGVSVGVRADTPPRQFPELLAVMEEKPASDDQYELPIQVSPPFTRPVGPPGRRTAASEAMTQARWRKSDSQRSVSGNSSQGQMPSDSEFTLPLFAAPAQQQPAPSAFSEGITRVAHETEGPLLPPVTSSDVTVQSGATINTLPHAPARRMPAEPVHQGHFAEESLIAPPIRNGIVRSSSTSIVPVPPGPEDSVQMAQVPPEYSRSPEISPLEIDPFANGGYAMEDELSHPVQRRGSGSFDPCLVDPDVNGEFEAFGYFGPRVGNRRVIGTGGFMFPLWQDSESVLFADMQGRIDDHDSGDGSWGLVYRQYMDPNWVVGGNLYYDLKSSRSGNVFNQLGLGFELLSLNWEMRINGYLPASDNKGADYNMGYSNATLITHNFMERAYRGIDWEVGHRFLYWGWNDCCEVRWFVGSYHFDHFATDGQNFGGPRGRLEMRMHDLTWLGPQSRLEFGMELSTDKIRHEQVYGFMRVHIPLGGNDRTRPVLDPLRRQLLNVPTRPVY